MSGPIVISATKSIEPEMLEALAELLIRVVDDGASIGFLAPLCQDEAVRYWRTTAQSEAVLWTALRNGQLVGTVQLHLAPQANAAHRAEVAKLMVDPAQRRNGIATLLLQAVEEKARSERRTLLVLDTRGGDPSNSLYRSLGYIEAGRIPRYARSSTGELDETVFYYKELAVRDDVLADGRDAMRNPLRAVCWMETEAGADFWLAEGSEVTVFPLQSGLEADVTGVGIAGTNFVLKVWNRESKPDVRAQYRLLEALSAQGLSVSKPLGWGTDPHGNPALWTRCDGTPMQRLNRGKLLKLAKMILEVHRFDPAAAGEGVLRAPPVIDYFFPGIEDHPDLRERLVRLVELADWQPTCLIHGDYNLGNIVEDGDRLTIIDWTNGQLGDPRYDIAWSVVLMIIYAGERNGAVYRNAFLSGASYAAEELKRFEAIACLRWLLLNRIAELPKGKDTLARVGKLLRENGHLDASLLH